jgi:hypothetical protein
MCVRFAARRTALLLAPSTKGVFSDGNVLDECAADHAPLRVSFAGLTPGTSWRKAKFTLGCVRSPRPRVSRTSPTLCTCASGGARHAPSVSPPRPRARCRRTNNCVSADMSENRHRLARRDFVRQSVTPIAATCRTGRTEARFNVAPACRRRGHHAGSASGGSREGAIVIRRQRRN